MEEKIKVLIVDDEDSICDQIRILLNREGYEGHSASSGEAALAKMEEMDFPVVLTDYNMPGINGITLLKKIKMHKPNTHVLMMTAFGSLETAVEAINEGVFSFIIKPYLNPVLLKQLERATEAMRLREENKSLRRQIKTMTAPRPIIGHSGSILKIFEQIDRVAESESTILIRGESGTGKELIALQIHARGPRAEQKFVSLNCGALTETLLESELFGHIKGSFTGAAKDKKGIFAEANGGTFFLDEIGETSLSTQVKLLRVLQEREITPVGSTQSQPIDVRIIAATNADLEQMIKLGKFRSDLFYRLSVIPLYVPALRERKEDLPFLCDHFLQKYQPPKGKKILTAKVYEVFETYHWPGNVRELENLIEQLCVIVRNETIEESDLPRRLFEAPKERIGDLPAGTNPTLEEIEKAYIYWTLLQSGWNRGRAAEILGIDPSTLSRKISRYNFERRVPISSGLDAEEVH